MPQPSKAAPAGFEVDTSKRPQSATLPMLGTQKTVEKKPARPTMTKEVLAVIRAEMPTIAGSRVLQALDIVPHSRLARVVWCVDRPIKQTTTRVVRSYRGAQWTDLTTHTPPHDHNRRTFSAHTDRFRLSGGATQGDFEDCQGSEEQTRVSLSFQEREKTKTKTPKGATSLKPMSHPSNPLLPATKPSLK